MELQIFIPKLVGSKEKVTATSSKQYPFEFPRTLQKKTRALNKNWTEKKNPISLIVLGGIDICWDSIKLFQNLPHPTRGHQQNLRRLLDWPPSHRGTRGMTQRSVLKILYTMLWWVPAHRINIDKVSRHSHLEVATHHNENQPVYEHTLLNLGVSKCLLSGPFEPYGESGRIWVLWGPWGLGRSCPCQGPQERLG